MGFIFQGHQKGLAKGIVALYIPRIRRKILIWYEVLLKLRVSFDVLASRKKFLSNSSHRTWKNIYVAVEVIDVHISVAFEFYIDEELI